MLRRGDWIDLARKLDWELSYVDERDVYPEAISGAPWLPHAAWRGWDEPYRVTYPEYVKNQHGKNESVRAVREAVGKLEDFQHLPREWVNALKLHSATVAFAEFAAVIGNLRAGRFARDSAWRTTATFGALDELRHTEIPLSLMHELLRWDAQFDWTHRLYHTNNWIAIAARHLIDELLLAANPIELAIGTNFVFETGFTNLQFVGLAALAHATDDRMFERMVTSIQSDEARHAQIGRPVLEIVAKHDPAYAQYLLDKWFWRSWLLFAIVTGFAMDYFAPVAKRTRSFKEFVHEWIVDQYLAGLASVGLAKPWYWDQFIAALDTYHHMVYASAYTYRATVWFDFVVPGPEERRWLRQKYPDSWDAFEAVWERIAERWSEADPGNDFAVHGTSIIGFCDLCQLVLCNGSPARNAAQVVEHAGNKYIFCSEPCRWIFEREPERYARHRDVVKRVLAGEAPGNLVEIVTSYFGLSFETWGKDAFAGSYPWLSRPHDKGGAR
jgi:toluene monooxygenase system protein A